jgi:hypothetical protein
LEGPFFYPKIVIGKKQDSTCKYTTSPFRRSTNGAGGPEIGLMYGEEAVRYEMPGKGEDLSGVLRGAAASGRKPAHTTLTAGFGQSDGEFRGRFEFLTYFFCFVGQLTKKMGDLVGPPGCFHNGNILIVNCSD